jgi:hypothetical protein
VTSWLCKYPVAFLSWRAALLGSPEEDRRLGAIAIPCDQPGAVLFDGLLESCSARDTAAGPERESWPAGCDWLFSISRALIRAAMKSAKNCFEKLLTWLI